MLVCWLAGGAVAVAGDEPNGTKVINMDNREDLIMELEIAKIVLGRTPKQEEIREYGARTVGDFKKEFGSWNDALRAAGMMPNRGITDAEIIGEIQRVARVTGKTPTVRDFDKHTEMTAKAVRAHFGRWNDAVRAAGFDANSVGSQQQYTDAKLREEWYRVKDIVARRPRSTDVKKLSDVSLHPFYRFGETWDEIGSAIERD